MQNSAATPTALRDLLTATILAERLTESGDYLFRAQIMLAGSYLATATNSETDPGTVHLSGADQTALGIIASASAPDTSAFLCELCTVPEAVLRQAEAAKRTMPTSYRMQSVFATNTVPGKWEAEIANADTGEIIARVRCTNTLSGPDALPELYYSSEAAGSDFTDHATGYCPSDCVHPAEQLAYEMFICGDCG